MLIDQKQKHAKGLIPESWGASPSSIHKVLQASRLGDESGSAYEREEEKTLVSIQQAEIENTM